MPSYFGAIACANDEYEFEDESGEEVKIEKNTFVMLPSGANTRPYVLYVSDKPEKKLGRLEYALYADKNKTPESIVGYAAKEEGAEKWESYNLNGLASLGGDWKDRLANSGYMYEDRTDENGSVLRAGTNEDGTPIYKSVTFNGLSEAFENRNVTLIPDKNSPEYKELVEKARITNSIFMLLSYADVNPDLPRVPLEKKKGAGGIELLYNGKKVADYNPNAPNPNDIYIIPQVPENPLWIPAKDGGLLEYTYPPKKKGQGSFNFDEKQGQHNMGYFEGLDYISPLGLNEMRRGM